MPSPRPRGIGIAQQMSPSVVECGCPLPLSPLRSSGDRQFSIAPARLPTSLTARKPRRYLCRVEEALKVRRDKMLARKRLKQRIANGEVCAEDVTLALSNAALTAGSPLILKRVKIPEYELWEEMILLPNVCGYTPRPNTYRAQVRWRDLLA